MKDISSNVEWEVFLGSNLMEKCLGVSQDGVEVQCSREVVYVLGEWEGVSAWQEDGSSDVKLFVRRYKPIHSRCEMKNLITVN